MAGAPTTEIGQADLQLHVPGWSAFTGAIDEREYAPDVRWPQSVATYERMETDAQVRGLLLGTMLPIRRFRWAIDPDGARDEVVEQIARDFNLPIKGEDAPPALPRSQARNRFSHDRHLAHSLRALVYGHYYFEQVGEIGEDGKWHLRKLAPRPPYTIANGGRVDVAPDGGLIAIRQGTGLIDKPIPVNRLVAYVWDQEGANWFGRSMLRACFKNWAIKDNLLRVDATNHARNGSGVPWFETDSSLSQQQVDELGATARRIRSGDEAGGAGPGKLSIKGVEGTLPDTIASVRYHDQQMSLAMLELFVDLGRNSETGSRSLGDSFIDWYSYAQESIADWHAGITTEHAIWDSIDWNYSADEGSPKLVYDRSSEEDLPVADLAVLIEKGAIAVDPDLEAALRSKYNLPEKASAPAQFRSGRRVSASVGHREPTEAEIRAATDFEGMQTTFISERDQLVAEVQTAQADQLDEIDTEIQGAGGDLEKLAAITVTPVAGAAILATAKRTARTGVGQVLTEAAEQGFTAEGPDLVAIDEAMAARAAALDQTLADTLAQAASKKALSLSGAILTPDQVATQVRMHLESLSTAYLEEQLGGLVTQAQNTGRRETMRANPPTKIYASELLDENTCSACAERDGTEYGSIDDAELDYSVGGYNLCEGGLRCRGTVVAEWS